MSPRTTPARPLPARLQPTLGLACLGFASALGTGAEAQTGGPAPSTAPVTPAGESGAVDLPAVSTTGSAPSPYRRDFEQLPRSPVPLADMPQSVTVVPRQVIQEQAATSVRDALRNVTGISLAAGEGGFSGDNLTLRGFSARGDFYIDGIRDLGQYTRDSFFLESVQVLKGPSSVLFGRGSTGGVINQTTRLPLATSQGELWLSGYSPSGLRATGDVNVRAGSVAVRAAAMASHIDAAGRNEVFNERWGIAPSITWGVGGPTQATLSYLHQEENNRPDYGVPFRFGRPAPIGRSTFYGLPDIDREKTTTDVVTARFSHRFNESLEIRNTSRYGGWSRELTATAPRFANTGTAANPTPFANLLVNRQSQTRDGYDSLLVNQTEAVVNVRTGFVEHAAIAGFEVGRESSEVVRFNVAGRPQARYLQPNLNATGNYVQTVASDIKTVADTYAVYAVDQMKLGQRFELLLGGRFDSFGADYVARGSNTRFQRTDEKFSWRAALVYKPAETVRTYVAYGTSFNPSAESLTLAANNAALPPELNESYEVGGHWDVRRGLRLSGSAFRIEKTNARTTDPASDLLQVLDGVARVDGFELSATGRITPEWNVLAGYTKLWSEITRSNIAAERGREFLNVAPNSASVWSTYELPYGFQLGGGAYFVDRRYGNTTNTVRVPSYTRYDTALAWTAAEGPLRGLRLQLNVQNLGDVKAYDTVYVAHVVPSVGRTFVASAAIRF